jgi:3-phosphoshikimate 1-carboxyvinyltransferase
MNGCSSIINPLLSDDTLATIHAWKQLGSQIFGDPRHNKLEIRGFDGHPQLKGQTINVKEAGTLLRFALAVAALGKGDVTFVGEGTLLRRSNARIVDVEPLRTLGVNIEAQGSECCLPIIVHGTGSIRGGHIKVKSDVTSQVISSLLIVSPLADEDTIIETDGVIVSRPYVDVTIDVLRQAGIEVVSSDSYRSFAVRHGQTFSPLVDYRIHGDYSSAAFLIAAACVVQSDITIRDLAEDKQGDRQVIDVLNTMGAKIETGTDYVRVQGPFELRGIEISCRDMPDLVPVLAAAATMAQGKTRIYDIGHLRYKESDRIVSLVQELGKLGVRVQSGKNEIVIESSVLSGGIVSSCFDHRIAMALALIGLKTGDLTIEDAQCISKSYPNFVRDLQLLGASLVALPKSECR